MLEPNTVLPMRAQASLRFVLEDCADHARRGGCCTHCIQSFIWFRSRSDRKPLVCTFLCAHIQITGRKVSWLPALVGSAVSRHVGAVAMAIVLTWRLGLRAFARISNDDINGVGGGSANGGRLQLLPSGGCGCMAGAVAMDHAYGHVGVVAVGDSPHVSTGVEGGRDSSGDARDVRARVLSRVRRTALHV